MISTHKGGTCMRRQVVPGQPAHRLHVEQSYAVTQQPVQQPQAPPQQPTSSFWIEDRTALLYPKQFWGYILQSQLAANPRRNAVQWHSSLPGLERSSFPMKHCIWCLLRRVSMDQKAM